MTEIPEHLLARSKARRQAIGQASGEGEAASGGEQQASSGAVEPAAAASPAAAGPATPAVPTPAKAPAPAAPPPPKPPRPEVAAAMSRKKMPWWAVPAVAGLPVWAAIYAFTLEPPTEESHLISEGGAIYSAQCSACHGATGGGGTGPAFAGGDLAETFPEWETQVEWVTLGSDGWVAEHGGTYGANDKPVYGFSGAAMPAFADELSEEEILLVVRYEREVLGGIDCEPELADATGEPCE